MFSLASLAEELIHWNKLIIPLRVQVPNNHILTQNLYYNSYYPKLKDPIIGYLDPLGTLIVPDRGLGEVGGMRSAQDSCRTDVSMRKCDELSSCRSIRNGTRDSTHLLVNP